MTTTPYPVVCLVDSTGAEYTADGSGGGGGDGGASETTLLAMSAKIDTLLGYNDGVEGELSAINTLITDGTLAAAVLGTVSTVNSAATSATLVATNTDRLGVIINNTDANALYVKLGTTATTSSYAYKVPSGETLTLWGIPMYTGRIDGIWAADGSGAAIITELT